MKMKMTVKLGSGGSLTRLVVLILAMSIAPAVVTGADSSSRSDPTSTAGALPADAAAAVRQLTQPLDAVPLPALPSDAVTMLAETCRTLSMAGGIGGAQHWRGNRL